jgi:hypothetical protein
MFVCGGWIGKIVDIVLVILVRQGINLSLTPPIATSVNILKKIGSCKNRQQLRKKLPVNWRMIICMQR